VWNSPAIAAAIRSGPIVSAAPKRSSIVNIDTKNVRHGGPILRTSGHSSMRHGTCTGCRWLDLHVSSRKEEQHMNRGPKAMLAVAAIGLGLVAGGCADRKTTVRRETETYRTPPRVVEEHTVVTPPSDETTVIERRRRTVEEDN